MSVSVVNNSCLNFGTLLTSDGVEFWDVLDLPDIPEQTDDIQHAVVSTDRIDSLAYKYYGDPVLWWVIAAANEMELLPTALNEGDVIRIPAPRYVLQQLFSSERS